MEGLGGVGMPAVGAGMLGAAGLGGAPMGGGAATGLGGSGAAPAGRGMPGGGGTTGAPGGFGGAGMVGGAPWAVGKGLGGRFTMAASRGLAAAGAPSRRGGRTMRTVSFFGSFMAWVRLLELAKIALVLPRSRAVENHPNA